MGTLLTGFAIIAVFLVASGLMFNSFLIGSVTQAQSLKEVVQVNTKRAGSLLNITGAEVYSAGGGDVRAHVDNTGSQSVADFADMDLIVQYTDTSDNLTLTRLDYDAGGLAANKWTVSATGVEPDSFNPRTWDSDETLAIDLRVSPNIKAGTAALVVVGTPWGVSDQSTVTNL